MALITGVWVLVNACIAAWLAQHIHMPAPEILPHVFSHIRTYMRPNVVADVVYALTGTFLLSRQGKHRAMLHSFGKAVLIQAVGLFVLDGVFLLRVVYLHKQYLAGL